tara:strand:+ start:1264 stop:3048 length:1785 start_codon:yes stop_codon:yes gene_type:complete
MAVNEQDFLVYSSQFVTRVVEATAYKSSHYALAELVDNSIQSSLEKSTNSCEVEIVVIQKDNKIYKILVLDNAGGMDPLTLRKSLVFGQGSKLEETKDNRIGFGKSSKYGAGLKQSSISQCIYTEIYSWQKNKIFKSYIDSDRLNSGEIKIVPEPEESKIPPDYLKLFNQKISSSGTLVIWNDMKKAITWKTGQGLLRNAEKEMGRIYRHSINSKKVKIRMACYNQLTEGNYKIDREFQVRANDPLFLMDNTIIKDHYKKSNGFDLYREEEFSVPGKETKVTVKFSVSSPDFHIEGSGSGPINALAGQNNGVSIVRNGREIELRKNEWNPNDTRERWVGIEVSFDGEVDDTFGVDAKKQSAPTLVEKDIGDLAREQNMSEIEYMNYISENHSDENVIILISSFITKTWNKLTTQIRAERGKSNKKAPQPDSAEVEGSKILEGRKEKTKTDKVYLETQKEDLKEFIKEKAILTGEVSTEEEGEIFAQEYVKRGTRFLFTFEPLPGQFLFDIRHEKGIYNIIINKNHPAHPNFINLLSRIDKITPDSEPSTEKGLKLLLESWAIMEDEATEKTETELQDIRYKWGSLANDFFQKKN